MKFTIFFLILNAICFSAFAFSLPKDVELAYHAVQGKPLETKLEQLSLHFVGRPYTLGPLGEGSSGHFDQDPLYRFDTFDCTTFVETIMALAFAREASEFETIINAIRYKNGVISFTERNHIPSIDWIPNNEKAGYLKDVTTQVAMGKHRYTDTLIDKHAWYKKMPLETIQVDGLTESEKAARLIELHSLGNQYQPELSRLAYISFDDLFENGVANKLLFDQIPSGSIINIVRPNWDLTEKIGTKLDVSHQGLAIRHEGILYLRHATPTKKQVVTVRLEDYLKGLVSNSTIKGINVVKLQF